jgi:hypothetical protein
MENKNFTKEYYIAAIFAVFFATLFARLAPDSTSVCAFFMSSFFLFLVVGISFVERNREKQEKERIISDTRCNSEQLRRELDIGILPREETYVPSMARLRRRPQETYTDLKEQHAQDYKNQILKDFSLCRKMYILNSIRYAWAEIKKIENTLSVIYHEQNGRDRIFSVDEWNKCFDPSFCMYTIHTAPKECASSNIPKRIKAFQELELKIRDNRIYFKNIFTNKEESISIKNFKNHYVLLPVIL